MQAMNRERMNGSGTDVPEEELPDELLEDEDDVLPDPTLDLGEAAPAALRHGIEVIQAFAKHLPNRPGVYRMFDRDGEVLYVGKAKNLKNRVTAYARGMAHTNAVARMIAETANMEFVTTGTETEALLLESNLIKQLRPRYNVLLRDDKSFPYILLTGDHPAPALAKHRGSRHRKGDYFGPFASVWAVKRTIDALQKAFLIRTCSDSFYENRTRPCLLFQIKRCSGPCTGEISHTDYEALTGQAKAFLSGRSSDVKRLLSSRMQDASENLEFERAARLPRPSRRAIGRPGRAGHQHAGGGGGRRLRHRRAGGAVLRRDLLFPQQAELGQPRRCFRGRTAPCLRKRCWHRWSRSSTTTSRPRASCCSRMTCPIAISSPRP